MIGLSFDKVLLVALVAALLVGPRRLPEYAQRLAEFVRGVRGYVETTRSQAEQAGIPVSRVDWQALNPQQYDPRRIIRDALADPGPQAPLAAADDSGEPPLLTDDPGEPPQPPMPDEPGGGPAADSGTPGEAPAPGPALTPAALSPAGSPPPRPRYVVVGGTSGHPKRRLISPPAAAQSEPAPAAPARQGTQEPPPPQAPEVLPERVHRVGGVTAAGRPVAAVGARE